MLLTLEQDLKVDLFCGSCPSNLKSGLMAEYACV